MSPSSTIAAIPITSKPRVRAQLGRYLGASRYTVRGFPKEVRWWAMATGDEAAASNEVDEVRWASPEEARALLSYEHERQLLDGLG